MLYAPIMRWLPALTLLAGCYSGLPEEAPDPGAQTDPAPAPLAELLYAGESGPSAARMGDRVRAMIWLRRMALSPAGIVGLRDASTRALESDRALRATLGALDADEAAALAPLYEEMQAALAAGDPEEEALEDWAARLAALQMGRGARGDPRALRQRHIDAVLAEADDFLAALDADQRDRAAEALFFLRRAVGPSARPATWDALMGDPWPAGDFATLRRSGNPSDHGALDISALWTLDAGEVALTDGMGPAGLQAVTALALLHPELGPACEALLDEPPVDEPPMNEDVPE